MEDNGCFAIGDLNYIAKLDAPKIVITLQLALPAFLYWRMTMIGINDDSLASIEFRLNWEKNDVHHTDAVYAHRVNFWRDLFPRPLLSELIGAVAGDTVTQTYEPGDLVPLPDKKQTYDVPHGSVEGLLADGTTLTPNYGRFYPRSILRGVPGVPGGGD